MTYPFKSLEKKWQKRFADSSSFDFKGDSTKPKKYVLEMFPYPSGKLHMGHVRNYAIGDVIARFYRNKGYNVLHPMGWDAFGLPAENAAIENNASPKTWTLENIASMTDQFKALGFSFAWNYELASCAPEYFGHEQKLFLEFYKKGLAYQAESWVNWDPVEHTVLANEQVVNGRGWRSDALVEKRRLRQWSLKITDYADQLLNDLQKLDKWPEKVVKMQENWIGKSTGALVKFQIEGMDESVEVFTTRPDTLYGASFVALAATHPLTENLAQNDTALAAFVKECQQTSTAEADIATAEKKGYITDITVVNPLTGAEHPLCVANFVLMEYGTGAVFGCPGHDERDFDFATKYNLPILQVVDPQSSDPVSLPYTGDGILINSPLLDGLGTEDAKKKAIQILKEKGLGEEKVTFRLRDWGISRQRYWGCPIPIVYCDDCGTVPEKEENLPLTLPDDPDFSTPGNPLDRHPTWKHTHCPSCGKKALRETDTFDTFFESSWYFLRFTNPHSSKPLETEAANRLMPVDCYIGGVEHAVLHLLYSRFFTKVLRDLGYVQAAEPFAELLTQGMVCHETYTSNEGKWLYPDEVVREKDGSYIRISDKSPVKLGRSEKMSKSKKNLVDPLTILDSYGADAARLFVLSDTPYDRDFDWNEDSLDGAWRYLSKLFRLVDTVKDYTPQDADQNLSVKFEKITHKAIKNITETLERHGFNKVIALHRELTRDLEEAMQKKISKEAVLNAFESLTIMIAPFAPHLASEMYEGLGYEGFVHDAAWPIFNPQLAAENEIEMAVQVNGKLRGTIVIPVDAQEETIKQAALALPSVLRDTEDKTIKKIIVVPKKIVSIVV